MNKWSWCIGCLLATILCLSTHANAGSVLLGDEPTFKGWEGKRQEREQMKREGTEKKEPVTPGEKDLTEQTQPWRFFENRFYGTVSAGLFMPSDSDLSSMGNDATISFKKGYLVGGAVGYEFGNNVRAEVEVAYRTANMDKGTFHGYENGLDGSLSTVSTLLNGYYDIPTNSIIRPYVGAGIGYSRVSIDAGTILGYQVWQHDTDGVFSYQASAGIGIKATPRLSVDLGYRYLGSQKFQFDTIDGTFNSHSLVLGLRYRF